MSDYSEPATESELNTEQNGLCLPMQLGRYELKSPLGSGGMASVYLAHDPKMDRAVAIKVLDHDARFEHEARAGAASDHANIVGVYDVGEQNGLHYIVMQYIDAADLDTLLDRQHAFTREDIIEIGLQLAGALSHSHQHQIMGLSWTSI